MGIQISLNKGRVPVKVWTQDIEHEALQQLVNVSQLPIIHGHVAAMPDVHAGIGATVGSVIPTRSAIIPAAVGVDIYVQRETQFGEYLFVTRKGAISAREGELGIIPGSMGAKSFIVRGLGNAESLCSCSHGAGRRMSRTAAQRKYSREDLEAQTQGVECRKDGGVLDEIPAAYKDIDAVLANQADLVEVVHSLKQVICAKGRLHYGKP